MIRTKETDARATPAHNRMRQTHCRSFWSALRLPNGIIGAADEDIDRSIQACETLEWIGGVFVVIGVVLTVGIAAFHPPYDSFLERWGSAIADVLVAMGVAIEITFGQMAGLRQDEMRGRSDRKAAEANERAAEANQKAEEARLALEKFKAPRRLSDPQAFIDRTKEFAGTTFAIAAAGTEAAEFALEIADSLTLSKWNWVNWPLGGIAIKPTGGKPELGLDMIRGMETHVFHDALKPLAITLFAALEEQGHECKWVMMPPPHLDHDKTVIIIIGSKLG